MGKTTNQTQQPSTPVIPTFPDEMPPPASALTPTPTPVNDNTAINFLVGYKTYLVAFIMLVYALSGWYLKDLSQAQAFTLILQAAGITGLRSGIESLKV